MIPKITSGGTSFKGSFQYYLHDKGADTCARVAWTHTENMWTDDPEKAWKVMAFTANARDRLKEASGRSRAGRKLQKPVFALSLAWHPEETPDRDHMVETARKAIAALGLQEHEAVLVAHKDEPQPHVHIVINRVHPVTGMAGNVRNSKRKMSDFARLYEREHGTIYCTQREENHMRRQKGKSTRYCDPNIVQPWNTTVAGKDYASALRARGYYLAQGDSRIVVIDAQGKPHNPTRHLNISAKEFRARLSDLDLDRLPAAGKKPARVRAKTSAREKRETRREKEARREAFEDLASKKIYELRHKHREEEAGLTTQQRMQRTFTQERLANYYDLQKKKMEIAFLRKKIRQARVWDRLLGVTQKDRDLHRAKVQNYRSAHARYREKMSHVENQQHQSLAELRARHWAEANALASRIEELRQTEGGKDKFLKKERGGWKADLSPLRTVQPPQDGKDLEHARIKPQSPSYPRTI